MHIFVAHLHEFKSINGAINSFNIQGLEKLNDLTTSQFFRATNRKKTNKCKKRSVSQVELPSINETVEIVNNVDKDNIDFNPFTNQELSSSSSSEDEQDNNKIWLKQMIELRNRNDEQSFEAEQKI